MCRKTLAEKFYESKYIIQARHYKHCAHTHQPLYVFTVKKHLNPPRTERGIVYQWQYLSIRLRVISSGENLVKVPGGGGSARENSLRSHSNRSLPLPAYPTKIKLSQGNKLREPGVGNKKISGTRLCRDHISVA